MSGFLEKPKGFATKTIHVGQEPEDNGYLAVIPPIVTSTSFKQHIEGAPPVSYKNF